jgi:hypothetical protein
LDRSTIGFRGTETKSTVIFRGEGLVRGDVTFSGVTFEKYGMIEGNVFKGTKLLIVPEKGSGVREKSPRTVGCWSSVNVSVQVK